MQIAIAEAAAEQRDLVAVETMRLANMERQAAAMVEAGELDPSPSVGFEGLRRRLARMRQIAEFLAVLADHEDAVRALDQRLARVIPSMFQRLPPVN